MLPDVYDFSKTVGAQDIPEAESLKAWRQREDAAMSAHLTKVIDHFELDDKKKIDELREKQREWSDKLTKLADDDKAAIKKYFEETKKLRGELKDASAAKKPDDMARLSGQLAALEAAAKTWRDEAAKIYTEFTKDCIRATRKEEKLRGRTPGPTAYDGWAHNVLMAWDDYRERAVARYGFEEERQAKAKSFLSQSKVKLWEFLAESAEDIEKFRRESKRHRRDVAERSGAPFQQKLNWDKENELKRLAAPWKKWVQEEEADMRKQLWLLGSDSQRGAGQLVKSKTSLEKFDTFLTYSLIAIGGCLLVGLFTRLASVGGAFFLISVVLSQPALPGIFPPAPPSAGHNLFVTKELIEMVALAFLATTSVGRWAGLDFFIHSLITGQCCSSKEAKK